MQGVSSVSVPDVFQFRLQAAMSGGPTGDVIQQIRLFNNDTHSFEVVDTRAATIDDSIVLVQPDGDLSRFVHPKTDEITVRVKWVSPGFSGSPFAWDISIDEAVWLIQ